MLLHINIFANLFLQPFYDRSNSFKLTHHFIATVPLYPFPLPFPLSLRVKTFDLPFNLSPVFSNSDQRNSFSFLSAYLSSWSIPFVPSRNLIPIFLPPSVFVASFFNIVYSARPFIVCSIAQSTFNLCRDPFSGCFFLISMGSSSIHTHPKTRIKSNIHDSYHIVGIIIVRYNSSVIVFVKQSIFVQRHVKKYLNALLWNFSVTYMLQRTYLSPLLLVKA